MTKEAVSAHRLLLAGVVLALAGCEPTVREDGPTSGESDTIVAPVAPTPGDTTALGLRAAAIVAFLQGGGDLDPAVLADTVTLLVAPEGGGARRSVARLALLDRGGWRVGDRDLAPPAGLTRLTTAPGRHMRCQPADLATLYPDLARQPHVGARLEPEDAGSCLQTWNATFVFGAPGERLSAVVYDQWEW